MLASVLLESYPPQAGGADPAARGSGPGSDRRLVLDREQPERAVGHVVGLLAGAARSHVRRRAAGQRRSRGSSRPPSGGATLRFSPVSEPVTTGRDGMVGARPDQHRVDSLLVTFSSGQRVEVVLSRNGVEQYRWSAGKAFDLAIQTITLEPGDVLPGGGERHAAGRAGRVRPSGHDDGHSRYRRRVAALAGAQRHDHRVLATPGRSIAAAFSPTPRRHPRRPRAEAASPDRAVPHAAKTRRRCRYRRRATMPTASPGSVASNGAHRDNDEQHGQRSPPSTGSSRMTATKATDHQARSCDAQDERRERRRSAGALPARRRSSQATQGDIRKLRRPAVAEATAREPIRSTPAHRTRGPRHR